MKNSNQAIKSVELNSYSEVNNDLIIVSTNSTSHCNISFLNLPSLKETCDKNREMKKMAKNKSIKIVSKYRTMPLLKEAEEKALEQYSEYNILFLKLIDFWKSKINNGFLDSQGDELDYGYELRDKISELLTHNTELSQFHSYSKHVDKMYKTIKDADTSQPNTLTLYY